MGFQEEDEKVQENIYREKGIKFSYSREWKEKEEEEKKVPERGIGYLREKERRGSEMNLCLKRGEERRGDTIRNDEPNKRRDKAECFRIAKSRSGN